MKSYTYDAFGVEQNPSDSDTNPFRYCGEYYDSEIEQIYLRARYYDPSLGRFTQQDPAMDGANWYVYCYNNPTSYIDYSGLDPGDPFVTAEEAAIDFGEYINEKSILEGQEYAAMIYEVATIDFNGDSKTYYYYDSPRNDAENKELSFSIRQLFDDKVVGVVHTHGAATLENKKMGFLHLTM